MEMEEEGQQGQDEGGMPTFDEVRHEEAEERQPQLPPPVLLPLPGNAAGGMEMSFSYSDVVRDGGSHSAPLLPQHFFGIVSTGEEALRPPPVNPLEEILTPAELVSVDEVTKQKLTQSLRGLYDQVHSSRTVAQQEKVAYAQHTFDLDSNLTATTSKLECVKAGLTQEEKKNQDLQRELESERTAKIDAEHARTLIKSQLDITTNQVTQLSNSNQELLSLTQKRNTEIGQLSEDIGRLSQQLQTSSAAKIDAMQKVDELTSREVEIKFRETQLQTAQSYQTQQIELLRDELERKSIELLSAQRDSSIKYIHLQTELTEKSEQLKITQAKIQDLQEVNEKNEKHVESLMSKLQAEQELRQKVEENFRMEIQSLKRVGELYKEASEESGRKLEELEDAVSSLQDLLKDSTDKYGQLETRFASTSKQLQEQLSIRDEQLMKLRQELKTANEIIDTVQKQGMTDEMIQSLSPAAAAASKMLKESKSITEIFAKYQEVQVDLGRVKCDNLKLNGYIREILEDIETRAPILQKQKEDYDRALQTVDILSSQMEVTQRENNTAKTEIVQYKRTLDISERENSRLKGQIEDLGRQVRCLLGERERDFNLGGTSSSLVPVSADDIITSELTTFRDIAELQKQNLRLLTVVRDLTEDRERKEKEREDANLKEIQSSFSSALDELQTLRDMRLRQDEKLRELQQQKDTLQNLLKQRANSDTATSGVTEEKLRQTEKDLQKVTEEFVTYKQEKKTNETLLNETVDKLRDEIRSIRADNARLAGQVEYNNERAKIYNKNLQSYKKQITTAEDRASSLQGVIAKHEASIASLKAELTTLHSNLSRSEVAVSTLTNERNLLRDSRNRLQMEKEMLQRHEKMSSLLQTNLEEIKNNLEANATAVRIKLENQVEQLQNENKILKRSLQSEKDRSQERLTTTDIRVQKLQDKLSKSEEQANKVQLELSHQLERFDAQQKELALVKQQQQQQLHQASMEEEPASHMIQDNVELIGLRSEVESLKNQLQLQKSSGDEYKNLSIVMESQLNIAHTTQHQINEEHESNMTQKEGQMIQLQQELESLRKELIRVQELSQVQLANLQGKQSELTTLYTKARQEYDIAHTQLMKTEQDLERVREDSSRQEKICDELRVSYEKEIILRGEQQKLTGEMREKLEAKQNEEGWLKETNRKLEEQVLNAETAWKEKLEQAEKQVEECKAEIANYQDACSKLEGQLTNALQTQAGGGIELKDGSSEQWLQLIRYLRREKEISVNKMEMALSQSDRLQQQCNSLEKKYEDLKLELADRQQDMGLLTSVKQSELMRKVETLSALADSNRLLREEVNALTTKLVSTEEKLASLQTVTVDPLAQQLTVLLQENDQLTVQNASLKESSARWQKRANELIEKTNKVNPEEMKRLSQENEEFTRRNSELEMGYKKERDDREKYEKLVKRGEAMVVQLRGEAQNNGAEKSRLEIDVRKLQEEVTRTCGEMERVKTELMKVRKDDEVKGEEVERTKAEVGRLEVTLEEHRSTVKQVKNIARKYKKQYEDLLQENTAGAEETTKELDAVKHDKTELEEKLEQLENQKNQMDEGIKDLQSENATLRKEIDMLRQRMHLLEKLQQKTTTSPPTTTGTSSGTTSAIDMTSSGPQEDSKLTASIRPITTSSLPTATAKLIVVPPQQQQQQQQQQHAHVQPMVQSTTSTSSGTLQLSSSSSGAFVNPVSQAQVSTSTPEYYSQQQQQQGQQRVVSVVPHVQEVQEVDDEMNTSTSTSTSNRVDQAVEFVSSTGSRQEGSGGVDSSSGNVDNKRGRDVEDEEDGEGSVTKKSRMEEDEEEMVEEEEEEGEVVEEEEEEEEDDDDEDAGREARAMSEEEDGEQEDVEAGGGEEEGEPQQAHPIASSSTHRQSTTPTHSSSMLEDASIVPSTPTLFPQRSHRTEGFAELTANRFTFTTSSLRPEDEEASSGRSVPTTPHPTPTHPPTTTEGEDVIDIIDLEEGEHEEREEMEEEGDEGQTNPSEVPTSSTTGTGGVRESATSEAGTGNVGTGTMQQQQQQSKSRPTPIVWDQPSSSSSTFIARPPLRGLGTFRPQARYTFTRGGQVSSSFTRQLTPTIRGQQQQQQVVRGQQSARRSRPKFI